MLNRRHLRIRALQILYAYHQSQQKDLRFFEKQLLSSIERVYDLYLYILLLMSELVDFEQVDIQERAVKLLPTDEDLKAQAQLSGNKLIQQLQQNKELALQARRREISWQGDRDLIRDLFLKLKKSAEFAEYSKQKPHEYEADKEFVMFMLKKVIGKSPLLEQHLEEKNLNWQVDKDTVMGMASRTIKNFSEISIDTEPLVSLTANWKDDKEFVIELFQKTILNDEEYQGYINSKTQNWEPDRIAMMDTILMKMAICELLNFSSIPTKVSMNEYIDISKEFSTPKSKLFINGILDKVLIDLKKEKKIMKTGRGLMDA